LTDLLFVLSKLLWLALRPGTFALLVAFAGLVAVWRGRRWGRWPILAGLGFYFALLLLPLHIWVQMPLEDRFPRPAEAPARVDGIVVLGGAVEQDLTEARGIPALNGAAERMTEPVALMRRYPEARLVFTGGQGALLHGGLTEADVARQLWTDMGVPPERMTFETAARNTHENAVLTHALAKPRAGETWLLVTSASHMPRSVRRVPPGGLGCGALAGELPHRARPQRLVQRLPPRAPWRIRVGHARVDRHDRLPRDGPHRRGVPGSRRASRRRPHPQRRRASRAPAPPLYGGRACRRDPRAFAGRPARLLYRPASFPATKLFWIVGAGQVAPTR
jgi:uncharacterized SAM-binding protein YcdF (DUF218 family)